MDKKILMKKILNMESQSNVELLRFDMYAVITYIILSKEMFHNNKEIIAFLEQMNLSYKPYVFKSRTILLGKIIRYIEHADRDLIIIVLENIKIKLQDDLSEPQPNEKKKNKNSQSNYMTDLLKRYSRNE